MVSFRRGGSRKDRCSVSGQTIISFPVGGFVTDVSDHSPLSSFFCRMPPHISHSFPLSPTVQRSPKLLRMPIEISESLKAAENLPLETRSIAQPTAGTLC